MVRIDAAHVLKHEERVTEVVLLKRVLMPGERYAPVCVFPLG